MMEHTLVPSDPPPPTRSDAPLLGEVVDARTGEPLPGARVAATGARELVGRSGGRSQASFAATAQDGSFAVHLERRGTLVLAVHARGYLPAIVPVSRRAERVRVALARGGLIDGVAAVGGARRRGALVRAFCASPLDAAEARTGPDGRFSMAGLRPGAWLVAIDGEPPVRVELAEGGAADVELRG